MQKIYRFPMLSVDASERQLVEKLLETLRALPEVTAENADFAPGGESHRGYDARVDIRVAGKPLTLLIEAKKSLYPRDVRQALWQLREFGRRWSESTMSAGRVCLLIAESISPGAKELLQEERVGYYDSGGSLFLPAQGVYLYVDKPPPKPLSKALRSLFSGRRAQVLHALLNRHDAWVGGKMLAEQAQVSPATASQVLTELERFDWLELRGQGPSKERHLREPAALLDAWAKQLTTMRPPELRRFYIPAARTNALVDRIAEVLGEHELEYAITHEAAAQRYAPFLSSVSQVRCRLMPGHATEEALGTLDARVVSDGANLAIIEAKSSGELLFREKVGGAWLASPVQVYLDLVRSEGRAKEMADHLRRERIGF